MLLGCATTEDGGEIVEVDVIRNGRVRVPEAIDTDWQPVRVGSANCVKHLLSIHEGYIGVFRWFGSVSTLVCSMANAPAIASISGDSWFVLSGQLSMRRPGCPRARRNATKASMTSQSFTALCLSALSNVQAERPAKPVRSGLLLDSSARRTVHA
jgi:hypothetical protein